MPRPRAGPAMLLIGSALVGAGSVLPWARVRLDLTAVFSRFPSGYRQTLEGREMGGSVTLGCALVLLLAGIAAIPELTRRRAAAGPWIAGLGAALVALMTDLGALVRGSRVAVDRMAAAHQGPFPGLAGARVSLGAGLFVVIAGAVMAMAGGVLLAARGLPAEPAG